MSNELSKDPAPDVAEENAWFPSPHSLTLYTASKTNFDGANYPNAYKGGKWRVLMLASDERYLMMKNGRMFSTGNHPVEMLLPCLHMDAAGFEIDVFTLSGNPVKLEMWAMPSEDEAVKATYQKLLPKLKKPMKLSEANLGPDSPYIAVFVPGGHGCLAGIPYSTDVKHLLKWAVTENKFIISLCHGPACLVAASVDEDDYIFKDYEICVFPDALDEGANQDIGYMPGRLEWLVGERLQELGVKVLNEGISGQCHQDRKLITGDSPLASNQLGKLAAEALLKEEKTL